jgi:hypothetical protein
VLRGCIVSGVREGVFGLALGAEWNAPDSVLRIDADIRPDEIQFQPGVFLVKGGPIREEIARRGVPTPPPASPQPQPPPGPGPGPEPQPPPKTAVIRRVEITLADVPADKMREVVKVAVLPLATSGATVQATVEIGPEGGIPRDTLELTVLEGLRQLGLNPKVELDGPGE